MLRPWSRTKLRELFHATVFPCWQTLSSSLLSLLNIKIYHTLHKEPSHVLHCSIPLAEVLIPSGPDPSVCHSLFYGRQLDACIYLRSSVSDNFKHILIYFKFLDFPWPHHVVPPNRIWWKSLWVFFAFQRWKQNLWGTLKTQLHVFMFSFEKIQTK